MTSSVSTELPDLSSSDLSLYDGSLSGIDYDSESSQLDDRVCFFCEQIFSPRNYPIHMLNEHTYSFEDIHLHNATTALAFFKVHGSKMNCLNLYGFPFTDDQIIEIISYCPNIKKLLSDLTMNDRILIEGVSNLVNLEEMSLTYCQNCTDKGLLQGLSKLSKLKKLTLKGCRNFSDDVFSKAICPLSKLETLVLFEWVNLSNESITETSKQIKDLKSLDVGWATYIPKPDPIHSEGS